MKKAASDQRGIDPELEMADLRGGAPISLRNLRTFSSLKNPVFRLYFCGMVGMMGAMNMRMMARSLLIYRITGSAAFMGVMSLIHAIPMLSLSLFGGVVADRVQKKHILLVCMASEVILSLAFAFALATGYLSAKHTGSWWVLAADSLLQGVVMAFMMPSRQAILREIVSEEQLLNAVALGTFEMNGLRLLAPALTGFLIEAFDFVSVFFVMAGMYLMAAIFMAVMPPTGTMTVRGGGALSSIKEGFQYIRRETVIFVILVFTVFVIVLSMPYQMLMPIFTEDILKVGAAGLGTLMSVAGVGAITGSLVLASLPNKKRGALLLLSCFVLGLALTGFSFSHSWCLSLVLVAIVGLGQTGRMALSNALLQYYTEREYLGRVMSIYMMEFGLSSLGTFSAGLLAETMGVQWAVGGFAMVLVFLSVLALIFVPQLRKLD